MAKGTKKRILEAALDFFAENGYAGTNIRELSESLDLGKSSLYRHFDSREEIWNAVIEMMISYYDERFGSEDNLPQIPRSTDELHEMTMRMVNFTVHDEKIVKTRKLLLTEQFRDEKARKLATRYFMEDTETIFERVFSQMMEAGILRKTDVHFLAFSYTAPITAYIHLCDREPEKIPETIGRTEDFIKHFINVYAAESSAEREKEIKNERNI